MAQPKAVPSGRDTDPLGEIIGCIRVVRGRLAIVDSDLAALYHVPVRRLHTAFRRCEPVPGEFRFAPDDREILRDELGKPVPLFRYAFTEHGCFMAALLLESRPAMAVGVRVVRAFARMREGRWD